MLNFYKWKVTFHICNVCLWFFLNVDFAFERKKTFQIRSKFLARYDVEKEVNPVIGVNKLMRSTREENETRVNCGRSREINYQIQNEKYVARCN